MFSKITRRDFTIDDSSQRHQYVSVSFIPSIQHNMLWHLWRRGWQMKSGSRIFLLWRAWARRPTRNGFDRDGMNLFRRRIKIYIFRICEFYTFDGISRMMAKKIDVFAVKRLRLLKTTAMVELA